MPSKSKSAKEKSAREKLDDYRVEFGVSHNDSAGTNLTDEEKSEYLKYQQLSLLKNIGYYLHFFVVLTIVGLIVGGLFVLSAIF